MALIPMCSGVLPVNKLSPSLADQNNYFILLTKFGSSEILEGPGCEVFTYRLSCWQGRNMIWRLDWGTYPVGVPQLPGSWCWLLTRTQLACQSECLNADFPLWQWQTSYVTSGLSQNKHCKKTRQNLLGLFWCSLRSPLASLPLYSTHYGTSH